MNNSPRAVPVICDMSTAPDTRSERLAEYGRLFATALVGREKTAAGIRFRFRADAGVGEWVRDLAAREKACCAFFSFTVTAADGEVIWDASVGDDDIARAILEEFFLLPDTIGAGQATVEARAAARGLRWGAVSSPANSSE